MSLFECQAFIFIRTLCRAYNAKQQKDPDRVYYPGRSYFREKAV